MYQTKNYSSRFSIARGFLQQFLDDSYVRYQLIHNEELSASKIIDKSIELADTFLTKIRETEPDFGSDKVVMDEFDDPTELPIIDSE